MRSHIDAIAAAEFTEIDHAGGKTAVTFAELNAVSKQLRPRLSECGPPSQSHVVLCFERVLDYLPAAWAAIAGGYSCLPWHVQRRVTDQEFAARLAFLARKLRRPIIVTTAKLGDRAARLGCWSNEILYTDQAPAVSKRGGPTFKSPPGLSEDSGAFLLCTSGSTGDPKIAIVKYPCALLREERLRKVHKPGKTA